MNWGCWAGCVVFVSWSSGAWLGRWGGICIRPVSFGIGWFIRWSVWLFMSSQCSASWSCPALSDVSKISPSPCQSYTPWSSALSGWIWESAACSSTWWLISLIWLCAASWSHSSHTLGPRCVVCDKTLLRPHIVGISPRRSGATPHCRCCTSSSHFRMSWSSWYVSGWFAWGPTCAWSCWTFVGFFHLTFSMPRYYFVVWILTGRCVFWTRTGCWSVFVSWLRRVCAGTRLRWLLGITWRRCGLDDERQLVTGDKGGERSCFR